MSKKIKDNYSFKEAENEMKGYKELKKIYDVSKKIGIKSQRMEGAFHKFEKIEKQYQQLKEIPDKFNRYFAERGWIAFEMMDFNIMVKCVGLAEEEEFVEAEKLLLNYFNEEATINFFLTRLSGIKEFRIRIPLINSAIEDHKQGRYHASVPLLLMMIDGFVNDIEPTGFFAENTDLEVWDTIAAHSSGLSTIAKIFRRYCGKTTNEKIDIPYRNGILHGRNLGYANIATSTKALATLFVLSDWAHAVKKGKKGVDKEYVPPTMKEIISSINGSLEEKRELEQRSKHITNWKRREVQIGIDIPQKGEINEYEEDTPEKVMIEFLNYLSKGNYGNISKLIAKSSSKNITVQKLAGKIRKLFAEKKLISYKLSSVYDTAPAVTEISVLMVFEKSDNTEFTYERKFRLIYEDENGEVIPRGYLKAKWRIILDFSDIRFIQYIY
ncbi:hypothetical protein [Bacillus cereus group sp. BfR-BA-01358]|uniref:hypothetical protein n=1 Tax=Bacillus cereus group sp. BfR-BA-01358 TaxID=2920320 RepID=UPI001F57BF61|nr:hypothetical protein [Bacillus cereus group sp. BfR-BA-01358]